MKIGLLYGGKSVEHAVSIRSATNLYQQMKLHQFQGLECIMVALMCMKTMKSSF